ncbi:MAG TPA: hypothetical protein VNZ57_15215 [Longimicrobiales bacterium]|nr:hypothetical protein [Longimicrobiales bacterium]
MRPSAVPSPRSSVELVAEYFLENRHRVLDIAAFLDRLDRAADPDARSDFRILAFREALRVLCDDESDKAARIQMIFSDPTTEPKPALDQKAARGAYAPAEV